MYDTVVVTLPQRPPSKTSPRVYLWPNGKVGAEKAALRQQRLILEDREAEINKRREDVRILDAKVGDKPPGGARVYRSRSGESDTTRPLD